MNYTKLPIVIPETRLALELKDIAEATERNDHNEAILIVARLLDNSSCIVRMNSLILAHQARGYMNDQLFKERSNILDELLEEAEQRLTPEHFEAINNAI